MAKLFMLVPVLLAWLPEIVKAVAIFETMFDPKMPGAEKKATVMAYLSQVAEKSKLPWGPQAVEIIGDLIDTVVNVFNFLKKFRHKAELTEEEVESASAVAVLPAAAAIERVTERTEADEVLADFLNKVPR